MAMDLATLDVESLTELAPIHVAHRGFERGLTVEWIYRSIQRSIAEGVLEKPVYRLPPSKTAIPINFTTSLVEYWKHQFIRGDRVKIHRNIWSDIDRILGVQEGEPF